jgi:outer membrane protein insertion porin family
MVILKLIIFSFIFWVQISFAMQTVVKCQEGFECGYLENKIENIKKEGWEKRLLISKIKSLALDASISQFQIREYADQVIIDIKKKSIIKNIFFYHKTEYENDLLGKVISLKENSFLGDDPVEESKETIINYLEERGYEGVSVSHTVFNRGIEADITFEILYKNKVKINKIELNSAFDYLPEEYRKRVENFKGLTYNGIKVKQALDQIERDLDLQGYINTSLSYNEENVISHGKRDVSLKFKLDLGERVHFSFRGNHRFGSNELRDRVRKTLKENSYSLKRELFKDALDGFYKKKGIYKTKIKIRSNKGVTKKGIRFINFYVKITEGQKIKLKKLAFQGNLKISVEELEELYYEHASPLSSGGFLDEEYLSQFTKLLKNYYLRRGFVFIDVSRPFVSINEKSTSGEVSFFIKERQQCFIEKIILKNVPKSLKKEIIDIFSNKASYPLNVVDLEKDLNNALSYIREKGFFYARILNLSSNKIIFYEGNYTKAKLVIDFNLSKKSIFDGVIITGNKVTHSKVIEREVTLKNGDPITPATLKSTKDGLNALGLFSTIQIVPYITNKLSDNYKVNLVIQVKEKAFGAGEVAPGVRSDLGWKLSTAFSRNNIWGLNHSAIFNIQVNRRFNLSGLDSNRKATGKQFFEFQTRTNYVWPYLFNFLDLDISGSFQRKRFSAFDADIIRIAPSLSKKINERWRVGLKYQLEDIRQFNATNPKDEDRFRIGGITPSIHFDLRDNPVSPRSGLFLGLSWEFANKYFLSQKDEDVEINFSKVISRNRFYLPTFDKSLVFAFSLSMGMQENYANQKKVDSTGSSIRNKVDNSLRTVGFIPSIKVFRLDGIDLVRGYADSEINRLGNGLDISKFRVQGKAYFTTFKFEPRFYMSDSIVLGLFYDAGKLFLDKYQPTDLRSSVGASFKFLTPVGTLDFDYGVKTRRYRLNNGGRESFGRVHLSIGYF